ncbi:hypothetical protein JCM10213_009250 [Rhodosporidiobolus nylandii]
MSRRPTEPPSSDAYLRALPNSSSMSAPAPSTEDHGTLAAPSYHSSPAVPPSSLYARPSAPSDVQSEDFHWGEDAASTIAPDDSVSQIDRRFTGRRALLGPRPMDALPEVPTVPEEYALEETVHRDYVPPELLEDDRSTVVPSGGARSSQQQSAAAMRPVNPSTTVGPLARARGEGSAGGSGSAAVPYSSPRQYAQDEEDEHDERPLVAGGAVSTAAAGRAGSGTGGRSGVSPYSRPSGYAAVGNADDYGDGGAYAAYSRSRDADLEGQAGPGADGMGRRDGSGATGQSGSTLVGALSNPLGYLKSMRRSSSGMDKQSFYTPQELAFQPPNSSSLDQARNGSYPPSGGSLHKLPSLDVAGPLDRSYGYGAGAGGGQDGSQIRPKPLLQRWLWDTTPQERRVWEHKRGIGMQKWPFASWTLAVIMSAVMIYELVRMNSVTGSAIQTKPSFNVMIGPSAEVLIGLGARFDGCIKYVDQVTNIDWTCPKDTNKATLSSTDGTCTMSDVCGFGGFDITDGAGGPNQSFRFFVPIFLHAGVVHLILNMLAQCVSSAMVERMMGTPRFLVLYLAAGIFGFVLGGNFALVGQPSVGASGAIFGTHAALLVDLLAHWSIEHQPKRKLLFLLIEIVIMFGLGYVPGIDNFSHLGGFLIGLLGAICLFPIVHPSRRHKLVFVALRIIAFPLIIILFVVLVKNFYTDDPSASCSACRYLSCWPTASNNHCKGTGLSITSTSSFYLPEILTFVVTTFVVPLL